MGLLSARREDPLIRRRGPARALGPRSPGRALARLLLATALGVALAGCGREDGSPGVYAARGTVEDVDRESAQVLIDHEDVVGLMPAMTMNFVVPDPELLAKMEPGQVVDFEIRFTGRSYEIAGFEIVGEAPAEAGWRRLGEGLVRTSAAPDFELIDQAGRALRLEALGDRVLVFDFIYTRCPGPCPVQTSNQVALQKRIPARLRDRVHFVSISLDPEFDRPEVLRRYASERGADLAHWSFLTGPTDVVAPLVKRFGVGSLRKEDGSIDHTLIRFLVQHGRVMERYSMVPGQDDRLLADIVALAEAPPAKPAPDPDRPPEP